MTAAPEPESKAGLLALTLFPAIGFGVLAWLLAFHVQPLAFGASHEVVVLFCFAFLVAGWLVVPITVGVMAGMRTEAAIFGAISAAVVALESLMLFACFDPKIMWH